MTFYEIFVTSSNVLTYAVAIFLTIISIIICLDEGGFEEFSQALWLVICFVLLASLGVRAFVWTASKFPMKQNTVYLCQGEDKKFYVCAENMK